MFDLLIRVGCTIFLIMANVGCSRLFFVPMERYVQTPERLGVQYENVYVSTKFDTILHGWLLKSQSAPKGIVLFLHGNGENISTHVGSIAWLTGFGYDVLIYDYQGYAQSTGYPNLPEEIANVETMLEFLEHRSSLPIIVYGQSLGGAIALSGLKSKSAREKISLIIVESSFPSFRGIVQEKLSEFFVTWPFQYPLSLAFISRVNPIDVVDQFQGIPILIVHGKRDHVVAYENGVKLFDRSSSPRAFWTIDDGGHIMANYVAEYRSALVHLVDSTTSKHVINLNNRNFSLPPKLVDALKANGNY